MLDTKMMILPLLSLLFFMFMFFFLNSDTKSVSDHRFAQIHRQNSSPLPYRFIGLLIFELHNPKITIQRIQKSVISEIIDLKISDFCVDFWLDIRF